MKVSELNCCSTEEAEAAFYRCCGCRAWAAAMAERRPYQSRAEVQAAAVAVWRGLSQADWLEAFAAHPRIGDINSLREKYANTKGWASGEQSGVAAADDAVLRGLAEGNRAYEEKFGFIFIVCATGKSAAEMLGLLEARLPNPRDREMENAAAEQQKITDLRILKWLEES
ncbi:MAG TPA: 2-oxo-4-hydroxy-4-carboxy-5-ureidoimidazoline decarboxylase [Kiritimatiellia bacterium]|nr:2-oxo-4-hydroxy-4-carboxy-5-ureidoimidazoline decarboxylase [Kiritimatiellia bacterium]HMO98449.1 2-oxo-4-hydroxy-4-carboxy-5-ureidoimidazoline decarboxylase [Kiritimatiellia bacterium]HMP95867.1 2-oxo-4-hydroxy-4-carboxy-5-ureidoimidazoline decarboxylase [Kiritimatiellia bacterium]